MYDNNEEKIGNKASKESKNNPTKIAQHAKQLANLDNYDKNEFEIIETILIKYKGNKKEEEIPYGVTRIGQFSFYSCSSLTSITIPSSVTRIRMGAFDNCGNLTSITIPDSVTSIGIGAFDGTAWYNDQQDGLVYAGKVAYTYKGTMPDNTSIVINEGTLGIADLAFYGRRNLTIITMPDSVMSIGGGAFWGCSSLTSITIPNNVTSIDEEAFFGCSSLTSIIIPNSVTSIGEGAFANCSNLKRIIFQGTKAQWNAIVKGTKWKTGAGKFVVQYTEQLLDLDNYDKNEFDIIETILIKYEGNKKDVVIPYGVTSIEVLAFSNCSSLTSIIIPDTVTSIGGNAFEGCSSLAFIIMPYSVTTIGEWAFDGCSSLTHVTIPDSVTRIEIGAFSKCSSLTNITIPSSVTSIGSYVFSGCRSLKSIILQGTETQWNAIAKETDWNKNVGEFVVQYTK
ncbi:MAG: leucine-rich repeat domain-containing protein [Christensenellales bacterium]